MTSQNATAGRNKMWPPQKSSLKYCLYSKKVNRQSRYSFADAGDKRHCKHLGLPLGLSMVRHSVYSKALSRDGCTQSVQEMYIFDAKYIPVPFPMLEFLFLFLYTAYILGIKYYYSTGRALGECMVPPYMEKPMLSF